MSDTPHAANDIQKLLDRDCFVVLYRNELGSYTAVSIAEDSPAYAHFQIELLRALGVDEDTLFNPDGQDFGDPLPGVVETDDFTPAQALYRLSEKTITGRIA